MSANKSRRFVSVVGSWCVAAATLGAVAAGSAADFVEYQVVRTVSGGLAKHVVYGKFNGPTDTVLNAFHINKTVGGGTPVFHHADALNGGVDSTTVGSWNPQFVVVLGANDSYVCVGGGEGFAAGNSTNADPDWGGAGYNQAQIPFVGAPGNVDSGPGWYNSSPPNLQGRVNAQGLVKLAQFVTNAGDAPVTLFLRAGYNSGIAGAPVQFAFGTFVLLPDTDADGISDVSDNCPLVANANQLNSDSDALGDSCDNCDFAANITQADVDLDTVGDVCDNCALLANISQTDADGDVFGDVCDNCPVIANNTQSNVDGDTVGDACDNCVAVANSTQLNSDSDALGNACDNCTLIANLDQANTDGDSFGNVCDNCTGIANNSQANGDGDTSGDACDNCLTVANSNQFNSDADAFGDACDNCALVTNTNQTNSDADTLGDACDNCIAITNQTQQNSDTDALGNACDNCALVANLDQANGDGDGFGNVCDNCVAIANNTQINADSDNFGDACDNCVAIVNNTQVNADSDNFGDACDNCAAVANNTQANTDGDTSGDACDNCVAISNSTQLNSDSDAFGNACDNCISVSNSTQANSDTDTFGDACDNCVAISNSTQVNSDTDALGDACDNCDTVANNNQIDCDASFVGDACEIASGALIDANGNGLVDCCEPGNECSSVAIEWPVSSGGNGHWYRLVTGPCRTWIAARDSALADHGYLATISSAAEGLRMRTLGSNLAWIGLYQDRGATDYAEPAGGWRWVSGEPLSYTNWRTSSNEPSNGGGIEDFAHIDLNAGTWNDTRGDDCMSFFIEYDADCSGDGIVDYGQIVSGQLADANGDGQPDCCASQIGCDGEYDVPSEFATVQLAIDAAPMTGGTIVKLAAGTYTAGFSLNGKDLIVRGDGPATTIIDGATATGSVVTFPGGEPATAGIEGLTIRNGLVGSPANPPFGMTLVGGGLRTFNSNAFVRNCIIENCRAGFGAGIYAYGGSILIDGCVFRWNQSQADGGGVMVFRCDTLVRSSLFLSNLCGAFGPGDASAFKAVGGRVLGGLTTMQDCEVRQNSATTNGAAIVWFEDAFGIPGVFNLTDCIVSENSSPAGAGGLSAVAGASVSNCVLLDSILCDNTQSNVSGLVTIAGTTEICDCLPDLYADGVINAADLSILLTQWGGGANSSGDLDHDGVVSAPDLAILLDAWGACP